MREMRQYHTNTALSPLGQSSIEDGQELDLESLEYLVGRVIYGGRVLRAEDQRVISSILREVLSLSLGRPALEEPPQPAPGEDVEGRGLVGLFPEVLGKVEDVQDFLLVRMCVCWVDEVVVVVVWVCGVVVNEKW